MLCFTKSLIGTIDKTGLPKSLFAMQFELTISIDQKLKMDSQVIFDNNHPKGASKEIKGHKIKPKIIKVISKSIKVENFKHTI